MDADKNDKEAVFWAATVSRGLFSEQSTEGTEKTQSKEESAKSQKFRLVARVPIGLQFSA